MFSIYCADWTMALAAFRLPDNKWRN